MERERAGEIKYGKIMSKNTNDNNGTSSNDDGNNNNDDDGVGEGNKRWN